MYTQEIKLSAADEVNEFVHAALNCDFDVDVACEKNVTDGKSLIGLLSLTLSEVWTVTYNGNNGAFESVVHKYALA